MASFTSFTNDEIKLQILSVYPQFVTDVDPDRLSDYLVQENVITIDQWQRIRLENIIKTDRCRALLSHLFYTQHPRAFFGVLKALNKENHYLLEYIGCQDVQESACGIHVQNEKQTALKEHVKIQQLEKDNDDLRRELAAERDRLLQMQKDHDDQKRVWEADKDRLLQIQRDHDDQKRVWEADKDRLLQIQRDHDDQKRVWEADKDHLLHIQEELKGKLRQEFEKRKDSAIEMKPINHEEVQRLRVYLQEKKQRLREQEEKQRLLEVEKIRLEEVELKQEEEEEHRSLGLITTIRTKAAVKTTNGLAILDKELFVVNDKSPEVDVYDLITLSFSSRWNLKTLIAPLDMTSCDRNKCLYVCDYKDGRQSAEILKVDGNGKLLKNWSTKNAGGRLSVTYESTVILTAYYANKLDEYSPDGLFIREINLSAREGFLNPLHAIKLVTAHFVVCHGCHDDELHRVCKVDADGKLLRSFAGKCGSTIGQTNIPCYLSVDGNGSIIVADSANRRVLLLDSDMKFKKELLSEEHGLGYPVRILLDKSNDRLFVADNEWNNERILIFNY